MNCDNFPTGVGGGRLRQFVHHEHHWNDRDRPVRTMIRQPVIDL